VPLLGCLGERRRQDFTQVDEAPSDCAGAVDKKTGLGCWAILFAEARARAAKAEARFLCDDFQ
jgi:hypothetical protein